MIVKTQKAIEFQNSCGCIVDYNELRKAVLWYSDKPVTRSKKIYLHGRYPAVTINREKVHVHRLLMMFWEGRQLETREHVHHKNENRLDASRSNLEIIPDSRHMSLHNKNKTLTAEHREKISQANTRRKGMKQKKHVHIPLDELKELLNKGYTVNRISKHFGCDRSTIKSRIHEHPHLLGDGK